MVIAEVDDSSVEMLVDFRLTSYEKGVFFTCLLILIGMLIIAAWSGILIVLGVEEGGGPIGLLVRCLNLDQLL